VYSGRQLQSMYNSYLRTVIFNGGIQAMDNAENLINSNNCLLRDLTGDGLPELIIGKHNPNTNGLTYNIYSYDMENGRVKQILTSFRDNDGPGTLIAIEHSHQGRLVIMREITGDNNVLQYKYYVYEFNGNVFVESEIYSEFTYDDEDDLYFLDEYEITKDAYKDFADSFWKDYTPLMANTYEVADDVIMPDLYDDPSDFIEASRAVSGSDVVNYIMEQIELIHR